VVEAVGSDASVASAGRQTSAKMIINTFPAIFIFVLGFQVLIGQTYSPSFSFSKPHELVPELELAP
jgi:hypothetical protein